MLALFCIATYNLYMQKSILKAQLYFLFVLTLINLIYFYYHDALPDHYFEITYQNNSINFITYYFVSLLANFGYWCGIWVTLSFVTFAFLQSLVFNKRKDVKSMASIAALLPLTLFLSYLVFPEALGEGLFFLIRENLSFLVIFVSVIFLSLSSLYLISDKHFFKASSCIWGLLLKVMKAVKNSDYSFIEKLKSQEWSFPFKSSVVNLIAKFRQAEVVKSNVSPPELKLQPKFVPTSRIPLVATDEAVLDEEIEEHEEDFDEEEVDDSDDTEFTDSEESLDSIADTLEEYEPVDSIFVKKKSVEDVFFDTDELINCIAPKNQNNKVSDPSDKYFETIARAIEEKLKEFNISSHVINVLKGPVVDTFELELGSGVKVAGVTNRTNDLSLALMGAPIRIVYPMKGKSTIGIEVPRNPRDVIYLDEVLKSPIFNNSSYRLPIAMGKDAYGDAAVIDLAATPHLLVAGTTGAGKSVFINTLLVSLIIKFSPKRLRLIMLDPKQLELALYARLPHLIMPVVTDPEIASVALLWTIDEMERRYSLLKDFGVKNIDGFNKKIQTAGTDLTSKVNKYYPDVEIQNFELPFIVVVVDEFADLMLSKSGKAIETSISRLAAKARASGIHIVLATQRPSTDIITGVIKANFPTRVSFRVFTNIDSRVILDGTGAEKLLGKGDMLFKQGIDILRMHSAYVDEDEIEALVDKLSTLPVQYDTDAMEFIANNGVADTDVDGITTDGEGSLKDEKYDEAVKCVAMHRVASASFLQRRLGVGYNRAANLIEEMERQGVVGPAQGSKPRKVLVPPPSDSTP